MREGLAAPLSIAVFAATSVLLLPPKIAIPAAIGLALLPIAWYAFQGRWLLLFLAAAVLLPPLPIPIGDTGPHPSILIAGIGVLAGLARIDSFRIGFSMLNAAFAAITLALAVSVGFALLYSGGAIAAASAARLALFGLGVYVYFSAAQGPGRLAPAAGTARALFRIALAAAVFGCVDFVFQLPAPAGFGPQFIWLASGVYRRAQGLFYEASTLGNFCAFFLVMAAAALTEPRSRRFISTPVLSAGVLVLAIAMLASFSRASILACAVSLLTLGILERRRWRKYRAMIALALLIPAAVVVFAIAVPELAGGYWQRIAFGLDNVLQAPDQVLSGRLENWRTVGSFIAEHPWQTAFGIGYKTLPYTQHLGRPVIADNMYLSALVEAGVAGLVSLLALNAAILAVAWRAIRRGSFYGKWIFCFWIGEMFQMLSADILTYWRVLPIYFWVLAQATLDANADSAD
jgi:O-antigen ligase